MKNPELQILTKKKDNGLTINLADFFKAKISYPKNFFDNLDSNSRQNLLANFTFNRTRQLGLYFPKLSYNFPQPLIKKLTEFGINRDLPYINYGSKTKVSEQIKTLQKTKISFTKKNQSPYILPIHQPLRNNLILSMSFGKDSLLSYALCKEIGLTPKLVFVNDMATWNPGEAVLKYKILKDFSEEEKQEIIFVEDNSDDIYDKKNWRGINEDLAATNAMLAFALEIIPIAYHYRAKHIIFGNEKNLDDYYLEQENYRAYPSTDQSTLFMRQQNKYLSRLTQDNIKVSSLIKPLFNLAEMQIISQRYPYLFKYLMSCTSAKITNEKGCCNCITCAWTYLYGQALGYDPRNLGLKENMFTKDKRRLFIIFNKKINTVSEIIPNAREEQLLSFLLAMRRGAKGPLMEEFKKNFLAETLRKEKILRRRFFGVHSTEMIPEEYREKITNIYKQELKHLS